jgi:alpha-L-fucosidase 2
MKKKIIIGCLFFYSLSGIAQKNDFPRLWYKAPANSSVKDLPDGWTSDKEWLNALPVGNGSLGAMVFGDVNKERLQLNEKSLWSGSPDDNDNPDASLALNEIRKLLFSGKFKEATELTNKTQICKGVGSGNGNGAKAPFGCFQTLGDLWMDFKKSAPYTNYSRELDLINGIFSLSYEQEGTNYKREVFASYPDKALIVHLTSSKANAISFTLGLDRPERFLTVVKNNRMIMAGTMNNGKGGEGMKYKVQVIPILKGGVLKSEHNNLIVSKSTEVTIVITASTNYRLEYPDYINNNYEKELENNTSAVIKRSYISMRQRHVADFSSYMLRTTFKLNSGPVQLIPTDELMVKNTLTQNEPSLYTLYFQYGRYLLLSSSRRGSLPANLQGLWANKIQTPWNGDYHTDVNIQMNYWPVEVANLSESHEQLIDLIKSFVQPGKRTAKVQYKMNGWIIHPITNVWGYTSPGEHPGWGLHVGAGAWINQHLWEHFAFNRDTSYLRVVWPVLRSSCEFYLDWLVKDPQTGKLVSGPASSPENAFVAPDSSVGQVSMGPSHDQEVIFDLFTNTIMASEILGVSTNDSVVKKVVEARSLMHTPGISPDGRLMEWARDYKEVDPKHRHVSHLFALYPGNQISVEKSPALAAAARKSLEGRGDGGNGWSLAFKICFWARLHDGDRALKLLNGLLKPTTTMETIYDSGGGSYLNLFDAGPPFQIDGNFGSVAGICEMLLQSQEEFIELLPALPTTWKNGEFKGLCARGGFVVDLVWKDNKPVSAKVFSKKGGKCVVKYGTEKISIETQAGKKYSIMGLF